MSLIRPPIVPLVVWLLAAPAALQQRPVGDLGRTFLHSVMGFSTADINDVDAGRVVARQMKSQDGVDVNIFGAVRINASADAFVQRLRDIEVFERKLGIRQAGRFHDPPVLADLDTLTLDDADIDALESCQPADCGLQLSAGAMARFKREVNWKAGDARAQAQRLFRQTVFEHLQAYRLGGSAAIDAYSDRDRPLSLAAEFRLLSTPGDLPVELPGLVHYLRSYPKTPLPGAVTVFYWNRGEFGLKPTVRLNHLTIYPVAGPGIPGTFRYVVATAQIYADHYFSATLELRSLLDDPAQPGRSSYLFYTTKSRVSGLTGFMSLLVRPMVKSRARTGMERYLEVTKRAAEGS